MGDGREGDWECSGCGNRNYAFRSFCNRCKQPRLLVDTKTPSDSKWLPRIGDWICTGCTNNNYASREKCKKCGQPKEVAAMPAIAMTGVSLPSYAHYFVRAQEGPEQKMNVGPIGNTAIQQPSLPLSSNWSVGGTDKYGVQSAPTWPLIENSNPGLSHGNPANQILMVPKGWRNGDWICNCGFHNYSSRAQCKRCNASLSPALGTKRLASDDLLHEWDNKRLNSGYTNGPQQSLVALEPTARFGGDQKVGICASYPSGSSATAPSLQMIMQLPQVSMPPTLVGKGAKQWRNGDWMCTNCNNHNFASREQCNRCKTQRCALAQPVNVA